MIQNSILRNIFVCSLIVTLSMISCRPSEEGADENTAGKERDASGTISSRDEALELLRDIGMSVFTDEVTKAPDFTAMTLTGDEVTLADFSGKVIFMNFWATWCGPCKAEMPTMENLYNDLKDENFIVLAVNQQEYPELVGEFINGSGFTFPIILDGDGLINYQYGIRGIPTTYIIGPDGNIIAGKVGIHNYDGELYRSLFRELM